MVTAFGNMITQQGTQDAHSVLNIIAEPPGHPLVGPDGNFLLEKWHFDLLIRGKLRSFSPSSADYQQAGILPDDSIPLPAQILRLLTYQIPNDLLATDSELLKICLREESGLTLFLRLEEWYHPNIATDEKPSNTSTFQLLAAALANNAPSLYVPDRPPNTHWSNWPIVEL